MYGMGFALGSLRDSKWIKSRLDNHIKGTLPEESEDRLIIQPILAV